MSAPPAQLPGLPEFSLAGKTIVITGGAGGLGLTMAEAVLDAGARTGTPPLRTPQAAPLTPAPVSVIDLQAEPSGAWHAVAAKAAALAAALDYHQCDVCDTARLRQTIAAIDAAAGGIHGLVAAAGIAQETPALAHTAADADRVLAVNVTGVFMAAQAAAAAMVARGAGGSMLLVASMSASIANRVGAPPARARRAALTWTPGPALCGVQRVQGRRQAAGQEPGGRVGAARHPRQLAEPGVRRHRPARGAVRRAARAPRRAGPPEYAGAAERAARV